MAQVLSRVIEPLRRSKNDTMSPLTQFLWQGSSTKSDHQTNDSQPRLSSPVALTMEKNRS